MVDVEVAGETLTLLPERAIYWRRTHTLLIADVHLGKAATFRAAGIPLGGDNTADDLRRLSRVLSATRAQKLIILGDLLHARQGRETRTLETFASWRGEHPDLRIWLVRGNHDRGAGDPPADWNIQVVNGPTPGPQFVLAHEPPQNVQGYALAGHLHPAAQLTGQGRQRLKLPCFWFGASCGVLPAFGSFTGTSIIQPQKTDHVFVVGDGRVFPVDPA